MEHGKFCRCSHTAKSHDERGCQMFRVMDARTYRCPCRLSAERVERDEDHFERVRARINGTDDPFR